MVDGSHRSDFCTLRILSDLIASFCRTFSYSGSRSSRAGHTPDCRIQLERSQFLYQTWIIKRRFKRETAMPSTYFDRLHIENLH